MPPRNYVDAILFNLGSLLPEVRLDAIISASKFRDPRVFQALERIAVLHESRRLRQLARMAMESMQKRNDFDAVVFNLHIVSPKKRLDAILMALRLGDPRILRDLKRVATTDEDGRLRAIASRAIEVLQR